LKTNRLATLDRVWMFPSEMSVAIPDEDMIVFAAVHFFDTGNKKWKKIHGYNHFLLWNIILL
jgi:hypothetical protein